MLQINKLFTLDSHFSRVRLVLEKSESTAAAASPATPAAAATHGTAAAAAEHDADSAASQTNH